MTLFIRYYRITAKVPDEVKEFNQSYLLLSNHYGRYDPFIVSYFIKKRPNFISSDAILRDWPIGAFFKGLGAIPKMKGVRDSHAIREMVKVIKRGGSLALFPEATRTWSGETLIIDPSIAKLAKLLGVPVITARMMGAYNFDPRWAKSPRRSRMNIDYKLAINKDQLSKLSSDEILAIIRSNLYQHDIAYQRSNKIVIRSNRRAEHLDLILFQCPSCEKLDRLTSYQNNLKCSDCGFDIYVNHYGFFEHVSGDEIIFDNPAEWLNWQNRNFVSSLISLFDSQKGGHLFSSVELNIEAAQGSGKMQLIGQGKVDFYCDKLVIDVDGNIEELLHEDIESLGPQFGERIELFHKNTAYRYTAISDREPGIKWELAINVVWAKTNQHYKLSPYFRELVLSNPIS